MADEVSELRSEEIIKIFSKPKAASTSQRDDTMSIESDALTADSSPGPSPKKREQMSPPLAAKPGGLWGKLQSSLLCEERIFSKALSPSSFEISLDVSGQTMLIWKSPLALASAKDDPESVLPPGQCNLYTFPTVVIDPKALLMQRQVTNFRASGAQLQILEKILIYKATDAKSRFFHSPDLVGAYLTHALVVGNTEKSLSLACKIFEANPSLLAQVHTKHRSGLPLFVGESNLHIAAVNQRSELLCRMLDLAQSKLAPSAFAELISSQV